MGSPRRETERRNYAQWSLGNPAPSEGRGSYNVDFRKGKGRARWGVWEVQTGRFTSNCVEKKGDVFLAVENNWETRTRSMEMKIIRKKGVGGGRDSCGA